jgi:hypothetical protein
MPDGSCYLLGSGQYVDRNGNSMTHNGTGWTDTLGRFIPAPPLASTAVSTGYRTHTPTTPWGICVR